MADLTTKTLGQVETVTEVGSTDNVLLESNGVMKKIAASSIGGTSTKDSYIVFLSNDDILVYQDGETDVPLLPSDIPSDNGLISIVYVEPDPEDPKYYYCTLERVGLDTTSFLPNSLVFFNNSRGSISFIYDETAGGFVLYLN